MAVTEDELADLLMELDAGRQSWIDGKLGFGDAMDVGQDEDMTIFGPFGGMLRGTSELAGRQRRAAQLFEGGEGSCEVVKTIIGGDVVSVIQIERNVARVRGRQQAHRSDAGVCVTPGWTAGCEPHRDPSAVRTSRWRNRNARSSARSLRPRIG